MRYTIETIDGGRQIVTMELPLAEDLITARLTMPRDDMLLSELQVHVLRTTVRRLQDLLHALGSSSSG